MGFVKSLYMSNNHLLSISSRILGFHLSGFIVNGHHYKLFNIFLEAFGALLEMNRPHVESSLIVDS